MRDGLIASIRSGVLMRKRFVAAGLSVILGASGVSAQPPQLPPPPAQVPAPLYPTPPAYPSRMPAYPTQPTYPQQPSYPAPQQPTYPLAPRYPGQPPVSIQPQFPTPYPGGYTPGGPGRNSGLGTPMMPPPPGVYPPGQAPVGFNGSSGSTLSAGEIPLPFPEQKTPISVMDVQVKRVMGGWQVWAGQKALRDLGENEMNARDIVRVFRDLRPTEWVTIGGVKPVVEYGLTNGRPALAAAPPDGKTDPNGNANPNQGSSNGPIVTGAGAKFIQPIDLQTARIEPIRGVWCIRDDNNILFNFGTDKASAEQTIAVIRKYGFNRVGIVGSPNQPAMSYLFTSLDTNAAKFGGGQLFLNAQVDALTRTGIPVPGVGYTGEMVKIDPQKVEARKNGTEWVVASGSEILGHFGQTEWAARDAARTIRDSRFTEYCKLGGPSDISFFLNDGKAPTRAPFSARERDFDLNSLKVQQINGKWTVTEGGRYLFVVGGPQEGETVIRVLQAYGFNQIAHLTAGGSKGGITFLVKNR